MDAQLSLGVAYATGSGVAQDISLAAAWWRKAAAQGSEDARKNLELMGQ